MGCGIDVGVVVIMPMTTTISSGPSRRLSGSCLGKVTRNGSAWIEGGGGGGRGVLGIVHGCSRMTLVGVLDIVYGRSRTAIRLSHPFNAGTEHVVFSPSRQTLLAPSAKRNVRCWASRMKGELHPIKKTAFEADFHAYG